MDIVSGVFPNKCKCAYVATYVWIIASYPYFTDTFLLYTAKR